MTTLARDRARPVEDLAASISPPSHGWVDALHVAAHLEAQGVTDEVARTRYESVDVFALAREVQRLHIVPETRTIATPGVREDAPSATWLHGLVYLLPAAAMPAAISALGTRAAAIALFTGGAIGWMWAGVATSVSFGLRGQGRERVAARVLLASTVVGLLVAALAGFVVVALEGAVGGTASHGWLVGTFTFSLAAYQLAAAQAFFHRRRFIVVVCTTPAVIAGVAHLAAGRPRWMELEVAATFILSAGLLAIVVLGTSALAARRAPRDPAPLARKIHSVPRLAAVTMYTLASAVFLIGTQIRLFLERTDLALGLAGLIVVMGVVEWRSTALAARARRLLGHLTRVGRFHDALSRTLTKELVFVVSVAAVASSVVAVVLARWVGLTRDGALVLLAASVLAGVYLLTFVLANLSEYVRLSASFAAAAALSVALPLAGVGTAAALLVVTTLLLIHLLRIVRTRSAASFQ